MHNSLNWYFFCTLFWVHWYFLNWYFFCTLNWYFFCSALFVAQELPEDLSDAQDDRPARVFKRPRFFRSETEINSTYVNSHMSQQGLGGDDLLKWACNQAFRHTEVRYQTIRKLSKDIRETYAPCGIICRDLHEPLDGNHYLWMHRSETLATLGAILKDPKFEGE